ncbi:HD domain-containing phosphohydrolase [Halanaerobacter jeridensis]|uniref:HD-GYP domain-containing protein (C-di-GMP phosphodiesterase class II) n=1 Tax=Halanaerobacter jeridensis TaxID=706427 RepID=A0A939BM77_9FIRM|nr:HD domain-containing phosphohydrolase [Halanaerobacter jeridensis]MBM7555770.1 HD-GYP domain-containing protein (c-di-GMP phosphodiesterase class II) [Halanaerobacter jeridensis]
MIVGDSENDFKRRNKILESIYNSIDQGVCLHEVIYKDGQAVDYKIVDANPAYEEKLNISVEQAKGSLGSEIYQSDKPPYLERYVEVAETGETKKFEDYFEPLGAYFEITVTSPESGKFITLFDDITDRKKRIKKLEEKKEELNASYQQLEAYSELITAMNDALSTKIEEVNQLNSRFDKMINLVSDLNLADYYDEEKYLSNLLYTAVEILPEADYGSVYMYEGEKVKFIECIGHDVEQLKELEIPADVFYNDQPIQVFNMKKLRAQDRQVMDQETFAKFSRATKETKEIITFDLEIDGQKKAGISIDIAKGNQTSFSEDSQRIFKSFYSLSNTFFKVEDYNILYSKFTKKLITSIVGILEVYDEYTSGHSENVAFTAVDIAEELNLSAEEKDLVYWAGMVHDIGKLLVPLDILNKAGNLTDEEYSTIKKHPVWGYKALKKSSLNNIENYVLHHHENWDGSGYPDGLSGEDIPLLSQVLSVADAWDAMTSNRSYRDALSREKALKEIKDNKGTQFAPEVVEAFLKIKNEI